MGAHRAQGVDQRGAPLDPQPLDRVGIVTRPGLRREGQEAWVEAPAATGAGLEQDLGKRRCEPGVEVVDAQDVAGEELALTLGR